MALYGDFEGSDVAKKEEETLAFWEREAIFSKTLTKESPEGEFIFYEGPPTANGRPGIHHLISRSFKDVIPRYKTMRGFHVRRKGGWDTHGLPVEIEVEKQLGLKSKKEIEEYGVAAFNEKCKESVWKYVDEWKEFTRRIGYWVDTKDAYVTYYPSYTESVWNIIKHIHGRDLLYQDYKVLPWCTRCGTALSSHELAQGYQDVKDLSVYVKFKVVGQDSTYLLAWTTTPWTLPGNVGLAVGEKIEYVKALKGSDTLIVAKERVSVLGEGYEIKEEMKGSDLIGLSYEPVFDFLKHVKVASDKQEAWDASLEKAWKVYPADFVTTTDGTGIVHTAVMYGQEDFELGTKIGLPKYHLVDETGHFVKGTGILEGLPVKDKEDNGLKTAVEILKYLQEHGNFFAKEQHQHTYPFCWRCKTPLIYYARDSWYIRMSSLRKELVAENEKINWIPEHTKEGRFGEWLREVKDWALSRDRYWGTPLPAWQCVSCNHIEVMGSIDELLKSQKQSGNTYTVVRHGESLSNAQNIYSAKAGTAVDKLTDKGKEEVLADAGKLKNKNIDLVFVSPFTRTRETADILVKELSIDAGAVVIDERLHEFNMGELDGKTMYEVGLHFEGEGWFTKVAPSGESHADVRKRMADFIFDIDSRYQNKHILIVTHGGPAQMLMSVNAYATEESLGQDTKLFNEPGETRDLSFVPYPHDANFNLDLHKPFIDTVVMECPKCKETMHRTPEVMDVWLDSGSMPFAQDHYPFENEKWIEKKGYPADYISEAIDQTRGWFYVLHAVGVLMERGRAFKNVICLGHILDDKGKKMSKSVGNVINPWQMISKYGADVLRFWMFSVNQPGESKNFDEKTVAEVNNKVFSLLRNIVKFYKLYENDISHTELIPSKSKNILDVWILALTNKLVGDVTEGLEKYETFAASRAIRDFIQEFSTWYIRRSRDRFKSEDQEDKAYALAVTRDVILTVSKLLAPFTPFFAEEVYKDANGEAESVHLEEWPEDKKVDEDALTLMEEVRKIVSLALEARMNAGAKIRQPLAKLTIRNPKSAVRKSDDLTALIKDEINVKDVVFDESAGWEVELDTNITPELKKEGELRELVRALQDFRKKSGLTPSDKVAITVTTNAEGKMLVDENKESLMKLATLSSISAEVEVTENTEESFFKFGLK